MPSPAPSGSAGPSETPSSSPTQTASYVPGKLTNVQNGLLLSEGLHSRIIAIANESVAFVDGSFSEETFHEEPDGAGVFSDPDTGGWIYVSNSEKMRGGGGVGDGGGGGGGGGCRKRCIPSAKPNTPTLRCCSSPTSIA